MTIPLQNDFDRELYPVPDLMESAPIPLQDDFNLKLYPIQDLAVFYKVHHPSRFETPTSKITWVALAALALAVTTLSLLLALPSIVHISLATFSILLVALAIYKIFAPATPTTSAIMQAILDGNLTKALNCVTEFENYHGENAKKLFAKDTAKMKFFGYDVFTLRRDLMIISTLYQMNRHPLPQNEYEAQLSDIYQQAYNENKLPDPYFIAVIREAQGPHATPHGFKIKKITHAGLLAYKILAVWHVDLPEQWKTQKNLLKALGRSKEMATAPKFVKVDLKRLQRCKTIDEKNALTHSIDINALHSLDKFIYA